MSAKYVIGIDLGTTNCVLAYAAIDTDDPQVELLTVPQRVSADAIESRDSLPSFLYLPAQSEQSETSALPWEEDGSRIAGEFARRRGAEQPERTVAAAKSWLCHTRVDRHQPILPWEAPSDVEQVSPIEASARYLSHLAAAWDAENPDAPFTEQQVVLTVPASFDAGARELTHEAALLAGLPEDFVLLEEPQAAVYCWVATMGDRWRKSLAVDDVILVCDVGGGTTDLTLVTVGEEEGDLILQRLAVGDHLLVGGDNMDLALAHRAAELFANKGTTLDPWQSVALWHSCRTAKESLLDESNKKDTHPISVLGRGKKLVGGTVKVDVDRDDASRLLADGFFPMCGSDDRPARQPASGFRQLGLPYESDPAITKHLAAFLAAHGDDGQPIRPTRVLFSGGVFRANIFRDRILSVMSGWFDGAEAPKPMEGEHDLMAATARGAAYYGWAKNRGGIRIRGGTGRSYYVGIETAGLAIPGAPRPLRALCVVPQGMEEGTEADVPGREIGLVVGSSARFRFFSSTTRKDDAVGDTLAHWTEEDLSETDSLEAELPAESTEADTYVPVRFHSKITELGMFELWCESTIDNRRWKLEFSVRDEAE